MYPRNAPVSSAISFDNKIFRYWEIFTLKIIHVKNFRVVKFSQFQSIREILTVNDYNMDECLESSWCLVYYQVSGELGIAGCSHQSDIYPRECVELHMQAYSLITAA